MANPQFDPLFNSNDDATTRVVPHNIEAEQALLGAILVNNEAFYRVSDFLEAEHFFEPLHQRIFGVINLDDPSIARKLHNSAMSGLVQTERYEDAFEIYEENSSCED